MSRPYSRLLLTAGLIALSIGGVTSAGALSAQAAPNGDTSVDGLLDASASGNAAASTAGNASDAAAAAAAVDDGASTANGSPVGAQGSPATEGAEPTEKECAALLENFEVYDLTETGFKLRWTLPDNHPEYVDYYLDGLGQYVRTVGDFPFTEAIGENIKPGTHYAVGVMYSCSDGSFTGTPMLKFVTPGVYVPGFDWGGAEAAATMNSSSNAGAEAAANATASSSGSASAEGSENAIANAAIEGSAGSGVSAAAEATANASAASSGVDTPIDVPASDRTSNTVANAAVARDERAVTDAAQVKAKALANTGQAVGGLQMVSVGLVGTGLIALLGSLAYRLRNRRA